MKSLQKSWIMWAVLVLVAITLFGPSAVAYAAPAPTPAFRAILQEITYYCSSIGHQL